MDRHQPGVLSHRWVARLSPTITLYKKRDQDTYQVTERVVMVNATASIGAILIRHILHVVHSIYTCLSLDLSQFFLKLLL